jgi:anti-anti-sigma regulatory factor
MTLRAIEVTVKQVPRTTNAKQQQAFLREIVSEMRERPYLVLDCSELPGLDRSICYLLVCCLEETLKRNGDAVLAALPSGAETELRQSGLGRIFDVFETVTEATHSFARPGIALAAATAAAQVQAKLLQEDLQSAV